MGDLPAMPGVWKRLPAKISFTAPTTATAHKTRPNLKTSPQAISRSKSRPCADRRTLQQSNQPSPPCVADAHRPTPAQTGCSDCLPSLPKSSLPNACPLPKTIPSRLSRHPPGVWNCQGGCSHSCPAPSASFRNGHPKHIIPTPTGRDAVFQTHGANPFYRVNGNVYPDLSVYLV